MTEHNMTGKYHITQLTSWKQFTLEPVMDVLSWWRPPADPGWRELVLMVEAKRAAVWVGGSDHIQGILIIFLPISTLFPLPFAAHFEVKKDAPRGLKLDLIDKG